MGIHELAIVAKTASVDPSCEIGPGAIIEDGVILHAGVKIYSNAYICKGTEIGENTQIHMGAVIGHEPQDHEYKGQETFTKIGKNNIIREYVTIHRGTKEGSSTVVGDNNMLMVQAHLGHNCKIADNVIIANSALLAGHIEVDKGTFISGNVVFHQFCRIGCFAMIGGFTGVNKDVPPYSIVRGPSIIRGVNLVGLRRAGFKRETIKQIKEVYSILASSESTRKEALDKIKSEFASDEITHLVTFMENSKRGICGFGTSIRNKFFDSSEWAE